MKVHIITHAKHTALGNNAATYDGHLTAEGLAAVEALRPAVAELLPRCNAAFRGMQLRHTETAMALGIAENTIMHQRVGNDRWLFALVEEGDEGVMTHFFEFLDELKSAGAKDILVVTSRFYPMMLAYHQKGGAKKFGSLQHFANAAETLMKWPGSSLPPFAQAALTEWEW